VNDKRPGYAFTIFGNYRHVAGNYYKKARDRRNADMATAPLGTVLQHIHQLAGGTSAPQWTERQLLDNFTEQRSEAAFTALVSRHGPMVLRVCRRVLNHEQDAEDAFQATFLVLARNAGAIRKRDTVGDWLHGVAYRTAMKVKRSAARRRNHEARLGHRRTDFKSVPPTWDDVQAVLDEEIQRLPACFREAFVLCVLEGKSGPDAAVELRCKEGTVKSRVNRARHMLQRQLARRGINLAGLLAALSVAESTGRAALSTSLTAITVRFGLLVAAGESAAGLIPAHIAALAAGVTRAMCLTKAKIAVVLMLGVGLFVAGAGALAHQALTPAQIETPAIQKSEAPAPKDRTTPKAAKDSIGDKDAVTFSGRVVDPDGKPVPSAKLHLIVHSWVKKPLYVGTTGGKDGAFRLSVGAERSRPYIDESSWSQTSIVATAEGYGPAVNLPRELASSGDLTLRLAKDDVPIQGRILDLQGKPMAGVTVRVGALSTPTAGDLTPWLKAIEANPQDGYPIEHRFLETVREATPIFPTVVTDAQGRFELKGIGRERLVAINLEGPTIARSYVSVRTRPGKKIEAAMFGDNPAGGKLTYYGATFEHLAAPGRPIIGAVRDKDTRVPLAGVTIQSHRFAGSNTSGDSSVRTVTDKDGKYRLVGMAKAAGNAIKAAPATGQPYLQSVREVEDAPGLEPITVDFDLKRGVLVKGRVLDKATEKPVFANVQYLPFADNPRYKNVPGFTVEPYLQTGEDGAFQIVALPGRGLLTARGWSDHYRMAVGADKFPKKDRYAGSDEFLTTAPHLFSPTTTHTLVEINPDEKALQLACDILLDPGTMPRGTVVGPDGKPLGGTRAFGLTAYGRQTRNWSRAPLKHAEFTVYGLEAKDERPVVFIHADKHLAGAVKVRGDAKEPLTVKLEPWGIVTGRLVTEDGKPQSGVLLQIADRLLLNNDYQTDKDGRFRIEGLAPGMQYTLAVVQNGKPTAQLFTGLTVKSGESRDLGDIQAKRKE
jgi:RNA polymerase sigma factor (sigma-70 family)